MQHFSYLAEIFVVGGIVSALIIAADLHSCRQPMRIMNSVWILTGLWASVIGLWAYFTFGRPRHCDLEEHNGGRKTGTKPETGAETRAEAETGARAAEAGADAGERVSGWFDTIWADDLPSRAVTVYMYLRSRADREGKCFPSVRTISRDTKLSMSTVRRALDDLVNAGYIQKQPRWRANGAKSSNQYVFRI